MQYSTRVPNRHELSATVGIDMTRQNYLINFVYYIYECILNVCVNKGYANTTYESKFKCLGNTKI